MIATGSLTERVKILKPTTTRGTLGQQIVDFSEWRTVWANVKFLKGTAAITVGEVWMQQQISVLMRYHAEITDRCRLVWKGKLYRIESANAIETDGSITIVATRIDEGIE